MALFSANQAFTFTGKNGVPRPFTKGVLMDDSDPDFKGRESLFEPVEVAAGRPAKQASGVEEATAEPNTKRSISTVKRHKAEDAAAKSSEDAPHFPDKKFTDDLHKEDKRAK
jgi:hypothetical protein